MKLTHLHTLSTDALTFHPIIHTTNTHSPYTHLLLSLLGTKEWLRGFYFQDASIMSHDLTNAQLAAILDPTSDSYRDLIGDHHSNTCLHTFYHINISYQHASNGL